MLAARTLERYTGWDWFAGLAARIEALAREIALALGRDALARADSAAAIALAGPLIERDACDEEANELVIRAHLAANQPRRAATHLRQYERFLERDLGTALPQHLTSLVTAS